MTREGDKYFVHSSDLLVVSEIGESSWLIEECYATNSALIDYKPIVGEQGCVPSQLFDESFGGDKFWGRSNGAYADNNCVNYCQKLSICVSVNFDLDNEANTDCYMFDEQNKYIGCISQTEPEPTIGPPTEEELFKELVEHTINEKLMNYPEAQRKSCYHLKDPADTLAKCVYEQLYKPIRCEGGAAGRFLSPPSRVDALCYQVELVLWAHCGNFILPCRLMKSTYSFTPPLEAPGPANNILSKGPGRGNSLRQFKEAPVVSTPPILPFMDSVHITHGYVPEHRYDSIQGQLYRVDESPVTTGQLDSLDAPPVTTGQLDSLDESPVTTGQLDSLDELAVTNALQKFIRG